MRIGKIFPYFGQKSNVQNSTNKQDLTSFGVENKTQLLSKESATALKNKFMADVSFSGYLRNVKLKEIGEEKEIDRYISSWWVGTDGSEREGSCKTKITVWEHKSTRCKIQKGNGAYYTAEYGTDRLSAVENAIKHCPDYWSDSTIERNYFCKQYDLYKGRTEAIRNSIHSDRNEEGVTTTEILHKDPTTNETIGIDFSENEPFQAKFSERKPSDTDIKIYFADRGERIEKDILDKADFIVRPPEIEDKIEDKPKKKSLWQRIFG